MLKVILDISLRYHGKYPRQYKDEFGTNVITLPHLLIDNFTYSQYGKYILKDAEVYVSDANVFIIYFSGPVRGIIVDAGTTNVVFSNGTHIATDEDRIEPHLYDLMLACRRKYLYAGNKLYRAYN